MWEGGEREGTNTEKRKTVGREAEKVEKGEHEKKGGEEYTSGHGVGVVNPCGTAEVAGGGPMMTKRREEYVANTIVSETSGGQQHSKALVAEEPPQVARLFCRLLCTRIDNEMYVRL